MRGLIVSKKTRWGEICSPLVEIPCFRALNLQPEVGFYSTQCVVHPVLSNRLKVLARTITQRGRSLHWEQGLLGLQVFVPLERSEWQGANNVASTIVVAWNPVDYGGKGHRRRRGGRRRKWRRISL